jgi:hypothetical protein
VPESRRILLLSVPGDPQKVGEEWPTIREPRVQELQDTLFASAGAALEVIALDTRTSL